MKLEPSPRISIMMASDPNYDRLVVEVEIEGELILRLDQDEGAENAVVEIQPREGGKLWKISMEEFRLIARRLEEGLY